MSNKIYPHELVGKEFSDIFFPTLDENNWEFLQHIEIRTPKEIILGRLPGSKSKIQKITIPNKLDKTITRVSNYELPNVFNIKPQISLDGLYVTKKSNHRLFYLELTIGNLKNEKSAASKIQIQYISDQPDEGGLVTWQKWPNLKYPELNFDFQSDCIRWTTVE